MKKVKTLLFALLAPILTWLFPVAFLYARNVKEVSITETFQPAGILLLCAAASFLIGCLLFRGIKAGAFFSAINGVVLGNFSLALRVVQRVIPSVRYWHLMYLAILAVLAVCYLICRFNHIDDGLLVMKIVFGALILINLVTAVPTMVQRVSDARNADIQAEVQSGHESGKRNIYYLLCDEYASFAQLEHDFGYDNSAFRNELLSLGFNVSESSRNDSTSTVVVVANIMQLDYIATDSSTSVEDENLTKGGIVHQLLKENGYIEQGIGDTQWLGVDGTVQKKAEATTADGDNLSQIILGRSFLEPFYQRNYVAEAQTIARSFDDLDSMVIEPNSSKFILFYVPCPHHPYYFDKNGNLNSTEKWINDEKGSNNDAYIGQLQYVSDRVLAAVKRIVELDPNSIIVLCSDHGNRFGTVSSGYTHLILNAVYIGGEKTSEIEGLSSVNTLRYLFNREFDLGMEYIDLPE